MWVEGRWLMPLSILRCRSLILIIYLQVRFDVERIFLVRQHSSRYSRRFWKVASDAGEEPICGVVFLIELSGDVFLA